ncbi:MAG: hypothetical protein ACP5HM_06470 [Anaerolineae bacterium]
MQDQISAEVVEQTWQRIAMTPLQQAGGLIAQMQQEQPYLMDYLMAVDELLMQHEREIIFYVGMVLWQMMRQSPRGLKQVTPTHLEQAQTTNYEKLTQLATEGDRDFEISVREAINTYPEPEVLRYMVEAINEEDETSGPSIRDLYRGVAFIHLKSALDAMIASLEHPPPGFD